MVQTANWHSGHTAHKPTHGEAIHISSHPQWHSLHKNKIFWLGVLVAVLILVFVMLFKPGVVSEDRQHSSVPASRSTNSNVSTEQTITNKNRSELPTGGNGSGSSSVQATVNGQSVTVPENGTYHKTIKSNGSTTTIDISSQHTTSASGNSATNDSSTSIEIETESSSSRSP